MTTIADLRDALDAIPEPLLGDDDAQVLRETLTSLDALESFDIVPTVVVFVGSSGSGKSSLVNAALGLDAVDVGPLRPTTDRIVMVGSSGPVSLSAESEYLHVPSVRPGLLVVDTPPWEHDPSGVQSAVAVADLMAVVVTPSRYGDASVAALVEAFGEEQPSALVLNRVDMAEEDRVVLLESVEERFGVAPLVVDEGGDLDAVAAQLVEILRIDSVEYQRSAVLRSAAASGSAYLANRMGDVVIELRRLTTALAHVAAWPEPDRGQLPLADSWPATKPLLATAIRDEVRKVDDSVLHEGGPLAPRIGSRLPAIDDIPIEADLDAWRQETTDAFTANAHIRWRRASAESMIADHAWRVALAPEARTPRRFRRVMGERLRTDASDARSRLDERINAWAENRIDDWLTAAEALGAYAPGALLAAAEAFDTARTSDG